MEKFIRGIKSNFLLPHIDYIVGAGSVFNINGNYFKFNSSSSSYEADIKAIKSDWLNVGYDIEEALNLVNKDIQSYSSTKKQTV